VVLICWDMDGERGEITVPVHEARTQRQQLEERGAVVYWSERLANPGAYC
jgi:hypothetical protein